MMNNLNPYNQEFVNRFKTTDIHAQLVQEYDAVVYDSDVSQFFENYDGTFKTPRETLGKRVQDRTAFSIVPFYYLEYLQAVGNFPIYDIGCGWNVFKNYIPNIVGIDVSTNTHADVEGFYDFGNEQMRGAASALFPTKLAFSILSIHLCSLDNMLLRFTKFADLIETGGRGFITFNAARSIQRTNPALLNQVYNNPNSVADLENYVRTQFSPELIPSNIQILVFDLDFTSIDSNLDGNLRIVFEKV